MVGRQEEPMNTPEQPKKRPSRLRHLRSVFLAGVFIAIPLVVTYLIFRWLFDVLDGVFQPLIVHFLGYRLPGVGLVALVVLVYLLGLLGTNVVGRQLVRMLNGVLNRTPIIQYVYSASAEVVASIRRLKEVPFKRVVLVQFPRAGTYSVAFVTGKAIDLNAEKRVPVFVPTSPTPWTGFVILLPPNEITDTDLTIDEAMRMVVSGGLLSPEKFNKVTAPPVDKTTAAR